MKNTLVVLNKTSKDTNHSLRNQSKWGIFGEEWRSSPLLILLLCHVYLDRRERKMLPSVLPRKTDPTGGRSWRSVWNRKEILNFSVELLREAEAKLQGGGISMSLVWIQLCTRQAKGWEWVGEGRTDYLSQLFWLSLHQTCLILSFLHQTPFAYSIFLVEDSWTNTSSLRSMSTYPSNEGSTLAHRIS